MKQQRQQPVSVRPVVLAACLLCAAAVQAQPVAQTAHSPWRPDGVALQAGDSRDGTAMAGLGLQWNGRWQRDWWGGRLGYHTEVWLGHWRADVGGASESYTWVALLPVLRSRADGGRSRWFVEGGIGVSLTDNVYRSRHKQFSTAFNFVDMLGVGYSFGASREHEIGLRVLHVSNADIRKPNPGMDSVQVRYARVF